MMRCSSFVFSLLFLFLYVDTSTAQCPHSDSTLIKWSSRADLSNGTAVVLKAGEKILLDVSALDLKSIVLETNSVLVFDNKAIDLRVNFIKVSSGATLSAGSENCPLDKKIIITFKGKRTTESEMGNDSDDEPLGANGLAIMNGGSVNFHGAYVGPHFTRLASTANVGDVEIALQKDVNWKVGDQIVVASTDFGPLFKWSEKDPELEKGREDFPEQSELRTIVEVKGRTIRLSAPLTFMHFGADEQRAEVIHLTRTIVFRGADEAANDSFGGHIMVRKAKEAKFNGVESYQMGQQGVLGRYPFHFHLQGFQLGGNMYVKNSAVHKSFQRGYVIHDSCGINFDGNVAYNVFGHIYFLEDGAERMNIFNNNVGIWARPVTQSTNRKLIPSEHQATIFWITNPNNTYTNNVAVGGMFGFWFSLPESPVGRSKSKYPADDPEVRPRWTPLAVFQANVAHSNTQNGLMVDDMLNADETIRQNAYTPVIPPYTPGMMSWQRPAVARFVDFLAYKNRRHGVWGRGGPCWYVNMRLSDNGRGFVHPPGPVFLEDSVIVGETDNIGNPLPAEKGRSRPDQWDINMDIIGYTTYDNGGPQFVRNVVFRNFAPNDMRPAGALGALRSGPFMHETRNRYIDLKFENSNRLWLSKGISDVYSGMAFIDLDGSVTDLTTGAWLVANRSILQYNNCQYKPEWNSSVCPFHHEGYLQLKMYLTLDQNQLPELRKRPFGQIFTKQYHGFRGSFFDLSRPDIQHQVVGDIECSSDTTCSAMSIASNLIARRSYTFRWISDFPTPSTLKVVMSSCANTDWVVFAVPYPRSALPLTLEYRQWDQNPQPLVAVDSLDKLSWKQYYYDNDNQHVYFMIQNREGSKAYTERWGFIDYQSGADSVTIKASCQTCDLPASHPIPRDYKVPDEDIYVAKIGSAGVAYGVYKRSEGRLIVTCHHGQNSKGIKEIKYGYGDRVLTIPGTPRLSPSRMDFLLSRDEWVSLFTGKMYVTLSPSGESAFFRCESISRPCSVPDMGKTLANPCTIPDNQYLSLYSENVTGWPYWSLFAGSKSSAVVTSEDRVCGSNSIKIIIQEWESISYFFHSSDKVFPPSVDPSKYKMLEFYAKTFANNGSVNLGVKLMSKDTDLGSVSVAFQYLSTLKVDDKDWTRIRLPLTLFNITKTTNITNIWFYLSDRDSLPHGLYIDEIRMIPELTEPAAPPLTEQAAYEDGKPAFFNANPDSGLSGGAIAGIVIAVLVVAAVVIGGVFYFTSQSGSGAVSHRVLYA